jgi:lipoic acid synthetase
MVGLGETDDEVIDALRDLRDAGVDVVTVGQYLRPTPRHHEVVRFVEPAVFAAYERAALDMGFLYAASGPLVRSSYRAAEVFLRSLLERGEGTAWGHDPRRVDAMLAERMDRARREAARVASEDRAAASRLAQPVPFPPGLVPAASLSRGARRA